MLDFWREQKALIYGGFLIAIAIIISFVTVKLPPGRMVGGIEGNLDKIVMATDAPDYIQIYRPETGREPRLYPSDERLNDMILDKSGDRIFVATKEGWLNIFKPWELGNRRIRRKLGDILQGVALSGDEKYVAVGLGNKDDYNARDVGIYEIERLMESDPYSSPVKSVIPMKGDIQAVYGNPDPANGRGYILSSQDDTIAIFDFATGAKINFVEIGNSMGFFRCRPDGRKGYGSINARQSVVVVDLTKGAEKTIKHIKLPSAPYYLAFNADGTHLYAGSRDRSEVYVIDTATDEIVWTYILNNPYAMLRITAELIAISSDEDYLYMVPQYPVLIIYKITRDNAEDNTSRLDAVQTQEFVKAPSRLEVIRPE